MNMLGGKLLLVEKEPVVFQIVFHLLYFTYCISKLKKKTFNYWQLCPNQTYTP